MVVFRKALKENIEKIENIYSDIHTCEETGMLEIGWIRTVYPTRETAENALERGDLFVAQDDEEVVGAAIINNQQVDAYKEGRWLYEAPDSEVMVLHTLVISQKLQEKDMVRSLWIFMSNMHCLKTAGICGWIQMRGI